MKKQFGLAVAMIGTLVFAGCMDSATTLSVNGNGSGTITVEEYYSPQVAQLFSTIGNMAQGLAVSPTNDVNPDPTVEKDERKVDFIAETVKNKAKEFGGGTKLVKIDKKKNFSGWEGFTAEYSFTNVSKIKIGFGGSVPGAELEPTEPSQKKDDSNTYTFNFTPGPMALLKVIPAPRPEAKPTEGGETAESGQEMMAQMMEPMIKGLRMMFAVKVNGVIVETNAKFLSKDEPGTVTIMDMAMDNAVADKEAKKLVLSQNPGDQVKLAAMNLPGVRLEDPSKTVSIKFRDREPPKGVGQGPGPAKKTDAKPAPKS